MDFDGDRTLPRLFVEMAERRTDKPFLWRKADGRYRAHLWREVALQVQHLAKGLIALGLEPGDRVALVSENRPEWLIADLAIMAAGGVTVPGYSTNTVEDNRHVLTHAGAKAVILSGAAIAKRLLPAAIQSPELSFLVAMDGLGLDQRLPFAAKSWRQTMALGEGVAQADLDQRMAQAQRGDMCCIIYTSGTGGAPRGVMLTHGSILTNIKGAYRLLQEVDIGEEVFLSFLPLSHAYEHTAGQFLPMAIGAQIYYAESLDKLFDNMLEAKPTIMTAVPRLYEAMHQRIQIGLLKASPTRRRLFALTQSLGRKRYERPGSLSIMEKIQDKACDVLVRRKMAARFGGRLKAIVSGGAALNPEIGVFFLAMGLPLVQGYGQTEASPVISANRPKKIKIETVGPAFEGLEVRIAEDGEILVRGEALMKGYWRDPEGTARAIREGWLHTGDIGSIDADGYLKITDRKKDIIVLSGGDNVSPARIEGFLVLQPEISQAMTLGERQPHLVGLIVADADFARSWAKANGIDLAAGNDMLARLAQNKEFHRAIGHAVDRVNAQLSTIERVRRFALLPEAFTIENAMLTPSMKIRRHKILERWAALATSLYEKT
jgi:long-chain acyl-CoA synthetase